VYEDGNTYGICCEDADKRLFKRTGKGGMMTETEEAIFDKLAEISREIKDTYLKLGQLALDVQEKIMRGIQNGG